MGFGGTFEAVRNLLGSIFRTAAHVVYAVLESLSSSTTNRVATTASYERYIVPDVQGWRGVMDGPRDPPAKGEKEGRCQGKVGGKAVRQDRRSMN